MPPSDQFRVGFVVKRYPRDSEAFLVREILAHEQAEMAIEIFALRPRIDGHFRGPAPVRALPSPGRKLHHAIR
jgi:hypothetical protein